MRKAWVLGAVAVLALSLAACGGGGGGGGGGGDVDPTVCGGATQGCITGSVTDANGTAIASATITLQSGAAAQVIKAETDLATANEQGWFTASGIEEGERVVCFTATGYIKTCRTVTIDGTETTRIPPVSLVSRGTAQTVTNVNSGAAGWTTDATTGGGIDFNQANSVCDADGTAVTGDIECYIAPVDVTTEAGLALAPQNFRATAADGSTGMMISSAMMAIECEQNGTAVNLCTGKTASVRIPIYGSDTNCNDTDVNPATILGWRFDEATGAWVQYDTGNFAITCGGTGTGSQWYTGTVDHLTWINGDRLVDDACLTGTVVGSAGGSGSALTTVRCWGSGWTNTVTANADGTFCVPVPVSRTYTCTAGDSSRWLDAADQKTGTAPATAVDFPVATCPADGCEDIGEFIFASPIMTSTLTWGASPSDLDSHFVREGAESSQIYYGDRDTALDAEMADVLMNKGSLTGEPYIYLDTDDITSYGPEVTTMLEQAADGTYRFCVRNYSGEAGGGLCDSSARVRVSVPNTAGVRVEEDRAVPTSCPTSTSGHLLWQVFEITVSNGTVTSYENLDSVVDSASSSTAGTDCFGS